MVRAGVEVLCDVGADAIPPGALMRRLAAEFTLHHQTDLSAAPDPQVDPACARLILTSVNALPRRLEQLADARLQRCATLLVCDSPPSQTPFAAGPAPALVTVTGPLSEEVILQRLAVMVSLRETLVAVQAQLEESRQQQEAWLARLRTLDEELVLAEQVQKELLPGVLPTLHGARLHTLFAPADRISGDFYDVFRLDESRVGIAIADATGHGVPAALMTALLKRSLRGRDPLSNGGRILRPDEVLQRLNQDLFELGSSQSQYVAALYAIYDESTRVVSWARGGVPYPWVRAENEGLRCCVSRGMLLGVEERPALDVVEHRLRRGESIIFQTDGLEALLAARPDRDVAPSISGVSPARNPHGSTDRLFSGWRDLRLHTAPPDWKLDDITAIAIEAV